jgi:F0F1-type ATP synthase delta subunit
MKNPYAQALYNAAQKDGADAKKLVAHLMATLKANGREKLLPSILQDLRRLEARESKLGAVVEVAHEKDSAHALKEAAAHGVHATKTHVNKTLIQGWRATGNGKLLDHSAKRSLIEIYRNAIQP